MKFTLKDYQADAVRDGLENLNAAHKFWHSHGHKTAFSLTAVTGAGKTVMAAATFEALFHGDDEFDFDADPGAVVIWGRLRKRKIKHAKPVAAVAMA